MWNKHINLTDSRALSRQFCKEFDISYCQVYLVDLVDDIAYGQYCYLSPPHILLLDTYKNKNKIGILMHELTHHLEHELYEVDRQKPHGYPYQLAKKRVIRWCEKNISIKPDWKKPLSAFQKDEDMIAFKL